MLNKSVNKIELLNNAESEDLIYKVYVGKPGCMCGCRGTYSYLNKYKDLGSKMRGYKVCDYEISDTIVDKIKNKFKKLLNSKTKSDKVSFSVNEHKDKKIGILFYETKTKYYALYFLLNK